MRYGKPILLSVIAHLALVLTLQSQMEDPHKGGQGQSQKEPAVPGKGGDGSQKFKIGKESGKIVAVSPGKTGDHCRKWFGGIGITYDGVATITQVFAGYPAAKAGMQVGDYIWNIDVVLGPVGTPVTFSYSRNGHFNTVTMNRAKVCTLE